MPAADTAPHLEDFLAADYPRLRIYMGRTAFAGIAGRIATLHPSRPPRWLSCHLPASLTRPELAELARLELALSEAFHAADLPATTFDDLDAAMARLDGAALIIHPSAQRFTVTTNAASLWASLKCGEPPPPVYYLEAPQDILVWRQGHNARFRLLGTEEARAIEEARNGITFAAMAALLAELDDPAAAAARAMVYLRGWIEAGIVSSFCFADGPAEK